MFRITTCGFDSHHLKPCDIEHKRGLSEYLLLIIKADSFAFFDQHKCRIPLNTVILYKPGTYIHYGCTAPGYNDDWIRFQAKDELDLAFLKHLGVSSNRPLAPARIHAISLYVKQLTGVFHSDLIHRLEIQDLLLKTLLLTLSAELKKAEDPLFRHKYYSALSKKRTEIYNNPSTPWTAADAAASLDISLSYFQHLYKAFFGCPIQQDIIKARLDLAKFYLQTSNMTITAVADFCGYTNELHFMRQFKKYEGITPSTFRSLH